MTACSHFARQRLTGRQWCWLIAPVAIVGLLPVPTFAQQRQAADGPPSPIEELVVTARKTEESIQDVPMSMQVLTADLLDVVDTTLLIDLQYIIPGLVVNNRGLHGAGIALRGIADQGGSSVSVATHMNGVYLGSPILTVARQFDLQRIEILKGPQGTLYGRNATGGSINLIASQPQDTRSVALEAAWGSFNTARVQGHVNVPFKKSAIRLAWLGSAGDGFIRNSADDRRFAEQDFWGLRASYQAEPTDRLQVNVMAQHVEDNGAVGELWLPRPDYLADPSDIRLATVTLADPFLQNVIDNVDVSIEFDLGFATLRSISAYARAEVRDLDDCAGMPILDGCIRSVLPSQHKQLSQELQLVSRGDDPVDWLVAVYLYDADRSSHFYQFTPVIDPNPTIDRFETATENTMAVFGQVSRALNERWRITGGLRLSRETLHLSTVGSGTDDSSTEVSTRNRWSNQSWRLDLEYAVSDEARVYAGVATGFKSGGIDVVAGGILDPFDPEEVIAYETGFKMQAMQQRFLLNAAAFYYDFHDLQVYTSTISGTGLIFETDNAARAEIYGLDIDSALQVADGFSVSAGLVWLPRCEFIEYRNDNTGDTLSGNKLARAPEWTTTMSLDYERPVASVGRFSARLEYNYRSAYFYTTDNNPLFAQDSFGLLNLYLRFEDASKKWSVFASARNLGNEDYFNNVFLQSSPGYPDAYEAGFGYRF